MKSRDHRLEIENEEEPIRNENKNQGLINTIINQNNRLKHIENKFSFMFGAPQPHKSWREFTLLTLLIILFSLGIYKLAQKYIGPWLVQLILKHGRVERNGSIMLNERLTRKNDHVNTISELKFTLEQQIREQAKEIESIHKVLERNTTTTVDRLPAHN